MTKIGILLCGHVRAEIVGEHGEYGGFFRRLLNDDQFEFHDYFVVDGAFPASINACDAYVLSGSAHGAYDDLPFIKPLEDFIRKAYVSSVPLVGICFGHQIMAQALGGTVVKFDGGWGLGVHEYELDLGAGPKAFHLNAVHQDQVIERPNDARVIGSSDFCENAALIYGDTAVSFQPHPEFYQKFMEDLIELRRGVSFSGDTADEAIKTLSKPTDNDAIAHYIKTFLHRVTSRESALA